MFRKSIACALTMVVALAVPSAAIAAIYSPTQTELAGVLYADFVDEGEGGIDTSALTGITSNGDGSVTYAFNTGFDADADQLWRIAMENTDITLDLTPYDAFNITFTNPTGPPGENLRAQIFVRSVSDTVFSYVNSVGLIPGVPVTASIPKQTILNAGGDPADISSFGIEFFGGSEFGYEGFTATASTSPQPPNLADHLLYSWETADNPGTTGVDERFEGWDFQHGVYTTGVPQPDHTHFINTIGATHGTKALQIDRLVTGNGLPQEPTTTTFRWGTQLNLDANAGADQPDGDFNANNTVDAADFTRWRDALGSPTVLPNDPTPGVNNQSDYNLWKTNFGDTGSGPNAGVLADIGEIVALINDPDAYSVSFDLHFEDQNPNPNPAWFNMIMAIQAYDGNPNDVGDAWWQSAQFDVDLSGLASGPVSTTVDFLLTQFDDAGENGVQSLKATGLVPTTQYLVFNLSTNYPTEGATEEAPLTFKMYIDNFRIRHVIPDEGNGGIAGVPEPSTALLALVAVVGALGAVRRRVVA